MSISVVVADDHLVVRRGLRALLESEPGISVIGEASDGVQTRDRVERLHAVGGFPDHTDSWLAFEERAQPAADNQVIIGHNDRDTHERTGASYNRRMLSPAFHNMFYLGLPWAEKVIRPVVVYAFLIVGLRLAGKRELAQLNPFDLVVLLTLSNTVQNAIIGEDNSITGGIIGAATLLMVNYVLVRFVSRHEGVERFIEGEPRMLIENGKVRTDCLEQEAISILELEAAAHKQGFGSLAEVDRAELDPNGSLAFFGN